MSTVGSFAHASHALLGSVERLRAHHRPGVWLVRAGQLRRTTIAPPLTAIGCFVVAVITLAIWSGY